jgi:hypothetical protein
MNIKNNHKNYILFDIEVMPKDLKIYSINNNVKNIIDAKNVVEFMNYVHFILDTNDDTNIFVGDYIIGFDIPILYMLLEFYEEYKNFEHEQLSNMLIEFAYDKTAKLIKYGCSKTSEQFEIIKNKIVFNKKYIDVKFIISTKTSCTSLKHFQGAILGKIKDFDFEQKDYSIEKLDEYGMNDVISSGSRFRHKLTQSIYKQLISISDEIGLYIVNFIPQQIILYVYTNVLQYKFYRQANKRNYTSLKDLDIEHDNNYAISQIMNSILSKLSESIYKQRVNCKFLDYLLSIDGLQINVSNCVYSEEKRFHNVEILDLNYIFLSYMNKVINSEKISKIINWLIDNKLYKYHFLISKLTKALSTLFSNTNEYASVDNMILKFANKILIFLSAMRDNELIILGLIENKLYVKGNVDIVIEYLKKHFGDFDNVVYKDSVFIYDKYSILSKNNNNTGIFDLECRMFEKRLYNPSIASTKKFINNMLGKKIHTISDQDYVFVTGPCVLGLENIKHRANMLLYGTKTLINHNKTNSLNKMKFRFQKYNEKIIEQVKHYYNHEYSLFFHK